MCDGPILSCQTKTDPKEAATIYNTGEACPLAGCFSDGLMTNSYDQASMGPHDRMVRKSFCIDSL